MKALPFAGAAILAAFVDLLGVLVRMPTWLRASDQTSSPRTTSPENRQSSPPAGQQRNPPQDQKQ